MARFETSQKQLRKRLNQTAAELRRWKEQEMELEANLAGARLHLENLTAEEEQQQAAVGNLKKHKVCPCKRMPCTE